MMATTALILEHHQDIPDHSVGGTHMEEIAAAVVADLVAVGAAGAGIAAAVADLGVVEAAGAGFGWNRNAVAVAHNIVAAALADDAVVCAVAAVRAVDAVA
ncbi:hypothetical protein QAD02_018421 [Eretmocerus hayati]|uniref:Uncharacterized protein n=1 Tax=Eretmocerus hayati TaxID=131215 RepID=A0ACC2PGC2_9HYME|nr:hypothetical protein QAD02_018421 [Eretmocerus hayati]